MTSGLALAGLLLWATASESSILDSLEKIDRNLQGAETALRQDEAQRAEIQTRLAQKRSAVATARVRKDAVFKQFKRRLRVLATMPSASRWALLGGAQSLDDYLVTTRVLRQVATHDRRLHAQLSVEAERLRQSQTALEQEEATLARAVEQSRAKRDVLAANRRERTDLLRSVQEQKDKATRLAQERRVAQQKLTQMVPRLETPAGPPQPRRGSMQSRPQALMRLQPGDQARLRVATMARGFAPNKHRLPWPASGPVRVAFGQRVELAFGTVTSHNGWDIGAAAGTRVQAVAAGRVVYAGWLRGYGQMVIIDHGAGYHSVAAHLASVDTEVGNSVTPGDQIGTVGDTGSLRGTVLYFEIRYQGKPVDPRDWLRR